MSIRQELPKQMISAMKSRDQIRLDTIRFILSLAKNQEIDLKRELTDDEMIKMLTTESKNRKEAIEQFRTGGREDIVTLELAKLAVIEEFLPSQMSDEELAVLVKVGVAESADQNFGLIMKAVMAKTGGKADGKRVSDAVRAALHENL